MKVAQRKVPLQRVPRVVEETPPAKPELRRWEARDEWGQPVVIIGSPDDEFPNWKQFKAIDAASAAELAAAHLVDLYDLEGPTSIDVRSLPNGDWARVWVDVRLIVEVEISAAGLAPVPTPQKLRCAKAKGKWETVQ